MEKTKIHPLYPYFLVGCSLGIKIWIIYNGTFHISDILQSIINIYAGYVICEFHCWVMSFLNPAKANYYTEIHSKYEESLGDLYEYEIQLKDEGLNAKEIKGKIRLQKFVIILHLIQKEFIEIVSKVKTITK